MKTSHALLVLIAASSLATLAVAHEGHEEWVAPDDAKAVKSPIDKGAISLDAGKKLYDAKCMSCHGAGGKGDGKASSYLKVKPADLTTEDLAGDPDGEVFWKITTGKKPMPGFADKMSETERWQVVAYVRALAAKGGVSKSAAPATAKPEAAKSPAAEAKPAEKK
jgi:mono/diheme cytochrome c family protein